MPTLASDQKFAAAPAAAAPSSASAAVLEPLAPLSEPSDKRLAERSHSSQSAQPQPCQECDGDRFYVVTNGPGSFDIHQDAWFPSEQQVCCEACAGTGQQYPGERPPLDDSSYEDDLWIPSIAPSAHHAAPFVLDEPDLPF